MKHAVIYIAWAFPIGLILYGFWSFFSGAASVKEGYAQNHELMSTGLFCVLIGLLLAILFYYIGG